MTWTRLLSLLLTVAALATLVPDAAAYYHPTMGRFIQRDPIGYRAGDANLYRYVKSSPTNYRDPQGMESIKDDAGRSCCYGEMCRITLNVVPPEKQILFLIWREYHKQMAPKTLPFLDPAAAMKQVMDAYESGHLQLNRGNLWPGHAWVSYECPYMMSDGKTSGEIGFGSGGNVFGVDPQNKVEDRAMIYDELGSNARGLAPPVKMCYDACPESIREFKNQADRYRQLSRDHKLAYMYQTARRGQIQQHILFIF